MVGIGVLIFFLFHIKETMTRPTPYVWQFLKAMSFCYFLIALYFTTLTQQQARDLLHSVSPDCGTPLPDKDYAVDCRVFTPE
jgi:phosphatidylserine synthase 2